MQLFANDSMADTVSSAGGFGALFGLSVAFGVAYLPVKRFEMGNGNICSVPVIKRLGVGLGIPLWSIVNMLVGWASSRFGWFRLKPEVPRTVWMNYVGVVLAAVSAVMYIFIKPAAAEPPPSAPTSSSEGDSEALLEHSTEQHERLEVELRRFYRKARCVGITLALLSGVSYGLVFVPIIYVQENEPDASQKGIHYIGATGVGALLASTSYFVLYGFSTCNSPEIPSNSMILPALLTGLLWTAGQACWLIANEALQASITFPIATTAPAAIVALIGTIFYREVKVRLHGLPLYSSN
ncbi:unnamed protein product [Schistocephalus solidus]|uniref:Transmembrane protein 144 n=1 Tax=Schistocephalus solidus TaxID=70667 RepID=A0A183TDR2_SCHSO|nr:unnamed protein product [Schistocephalus solidus]